MRTLPPDAAAAVEARLQKANAEDVAKSGLSFDELRSRSFVRILKNRRA